MAIRLESELLYTSHDTNWLRNSRILLTIGVHTQIGSSWHEIPIWSIEPQ